MFNNIYNSIFTNLIILNYFEFYAYFSLVVPILFLFSIYNNNVSNKIINKLYFCLFFFVICLLGLIYVSNIFMIYILIEFIAFISYLILSFTCMRSLQCEALIKYFIINAVASIFILYATVLYHFINRNLGFSTLSFFLLDIINSADTVSLIIAISAAIMFIFGFLFKIGAFPGIAWLADIYDGLSLNVLALFTTFYKFSLFFVFIKLLVIVLFPVYIIWSPVLLIVAILSLFIGTFSAIVQYKVRRFIAYSSTAQLAYAILGLSIGTTSGMIVGLNFYVTYLLTSVLFFFLLVGLKVYDGGYIKYQDLASRATAFTYLSDLQNMRFSTNLVLFGVYLITILSWAGIPPFGSFFLKFAILQNLFNSTSNFTIIIVVIVNSLISTYYYLRLLGIWKFNIRVISNKNTIHIVQIPMNILFYVLSLLGNLFILQINKNGGSRLSNAIIDIYYYYFSSYYWTIGNDLFMVFIKYLSIFILFCNVFAFISIGWF